MVNITYGALQCSANPCVDLPYSIVPSGTDLIATIDNAGSRTVVAYSSGDISFVLMCGALVWVMIPGLGYLYSGLVRRKNALTLLLLTSMSRRLITAHYYTHQRFTVLCMAIISFCWFFWAVSRFSLASNTRLNRLCSTA